MNIAGSFQLGFIYALLALGIYIAFRVMNTPDLTADGSFTLGLCVSAMFTVAGHPFLGLLAGLVSGAAAGLITGLLQTLGGIHPILAGILTMTGLYSINLVAMAGSPNVSLIGENTLFSLAQELFGFANRQIIRLAVPLLLCVLLTALLAWFFKTGLGLMIRATGNNEKMVRASSINGSVMRVTAIAAANGFIGLSGAVLAQYQGYADINAGSGMVIIGLASVIIGETFMHPRSIGTGLLSAALGAVIYRIIIAFVLYLNFLPAYMLKFLSAVIVAVALCAPKIQNLIKRGHHA
ncbi:ABC transporter permease [Spirochaetia bacterium]|nr:ABC transporter permease [Spirochaetia bacterium]